MKNLGDNMKRFLMIIFSFLFISTAFVGGSLLLSGCDSSNVSESVPEEPSDDDENITDENPSEDSGGGFAI